MRHPGILLSFEYVRKGPLKDLTRAALGKDVCDIMIDSGAFSAHRLGHHIRITSYIEACKEFLSHPEVWGCVMLDKIGNVEQTRRNLDHMVAAGVRPMPVLTTDAPLDLLKEYTQINKRTCIAGGLGKFTGHDRWIKNRLLTATTAYPEAQFHALGYVRWPEMFQTKVRTVDSSSHSAGERYGCMAYFDRAKGVVNLRRQCQNANEPWETMDKQLRWYIDACGVTKTQWRTNGLMNVGPLSFASFSMTAASVAQSMFAQRHNLTVFMAASNWNAWVRCSACARHLLDNGAFDYWRARSDMARLMEMPQSRRHAAAVRYMQEVNSIHA